MKLTEDVFQSFLWDGTTFA